MTISDVALRDQSRFLWAARLDRCDTGGWRGDDMICPFKLNETAARRDGINVWLYELMLPARLFTLHCFNRIHALSIAGIPIMLDDLDGIVSTTPIDFSLGREVTAGSIIRLDVAAASDNPRVPPFVVLKFPRAEPLPLPRENRRRRSRVIVIR